MQLGTVGITAYAASMLGEVVFVELPAVDSYVGQGGTIALLKWTK
jgi:glycine cleavage system H lipoate-binding protein